MIYSIRPKRFGTKLITNIGVAKRGGPVVLRLPNPGIKFYQGRDGNTAFNARCYTDSTGQFLQRRWRQSAKEFWKLQQKFEFNLVLDIHLLT